MTYKSAVLLSNPQVYWRMSATSGTAETNLGSASYNGTYTNLAGYTLNQTGALFGDSDPSVKLTRASAGYVHGPSALSGQTAARSFEAWINGVNFNQTFANNQGLMGEQNGNSGWFFYTYSFGLIFGTYSSDGTPGFRNASAAGLVSAGVWHHVVGTWDGLKTLTIYLDNVQVGQLVNANNILPVASTIPFDAGRSAGGTNYLDGNIDEVAIYTKTLSTDEISFHYRVGIGERQLASAGAG